MGQTGTKTQHEVAPQPSFGDVSEQEVLIEGPSDTILQRARLLWERRRLLLRSAAVGLALGTLLAFLLPKKFESTTQLMPPDNQSSSGMAMLAALSAKTGGGLGAFAGDLLGVKSSGALFVGILRSRTVEDRLVQRFELKKVYWTSLDETARRKLEENTALSEDRKSGILSITVTDGDPTRAASMAKAYVEELDRLVAQLSTSSARREREFLEDRLKTVQLDLEAAEKEFSQFASKNGAIDIKEQGRAMVEAAATLEGQLIAAKSELEGLKQIYTDNNVRVRATKARIAELQNQLNKVGGKGESTSPTEGGAEGDRLYPSIRKLPILGVAFADLFRRTKVQEAVYEALTQQYELAKVQEAKETPSVKILDEARVPEKKSFPPRLMIIFLCTFLAFALATVFTIGQARWAEIDTQDPGKLFTQEVFQTVRARLPWAHSNGLKSHGPTQVADRDSVRHDDSAERQITR
ncbi:MAG TPA: Wzz/FepE/Etk N-terminal domain-containing protein [Candidatus Acidoferrum sp.]|nr:Wzz/FepE/Etk N-terminal domain-containing protein [Candidatus Acidoferrum sp.]